MQSKRVRDSSTSLGMTKACRTPLGWKLDKMRMAVSTFNAQPPRFNRLPRDPWQIRHCIEMFVTRKDRQLMLARLRCDPEIMPWNWSAFGRQLASQPRVMRGCNAIDWQRRKFLFDHPEPLLISCAGDVILGYQNEIRRARSAKARCVGR